MGFKALGLLGIAVLLNACTGEKSDLLKNYVDLDSNDQILSLDQHQFSIQKSRNKDSADTLLVGYPVELLGQQSLFGGTITEVSATQDESLGGLKMSSLSLLHVTPSLHIEANGQKFVVLKGCKKECTETAGLSAVAKFPVTKTDEKAGLVYLDLSALAAQLDMMQFMYEGSQEAAPWKLVSAVTRSFDASLSTLVFDIVATYQVSDMTVQAEPAAPKEFSVTTRWYLRLSNMGTPFFETRSPHSKLGYFGTDRRGQRMISRFRTPTADSGPIKYYIKNVPPEYKQAFADGFEEWNEKTKDLFHARFLDYEFVDVGDPRQKVLVAGDIRYNIMEWDLVNVAGYGGLGPSVALEDTGEIVSGRVLIQGPKVVDLYKSWYQAKTTKDQVKISRKLAAKPTALRLKVELNGFDFDIPSQRAELFDDTGLRMDFRAPPAGMDYYTYMRGYFRDMVAHELGHNLGLAHNFLGNLSANSSESLGSVSSSIMEYLGASYRHLNVVGDYDVAAIAYGYMGVEPQFKKLAYCGDSASAPSPQNSAECSNEDAGPDPLGYFEFILREVMSKAVALGQSEKPDWQVEDLQRPLDFSVRGMARYAISAPWTAKSWQAFFIPGRPTDVTEIPMFILGRMNQIICDEDFDRAAAQKPSEDIRIASKENLQAVRDAVSIALKGFQRPFSLGQSQYFPCLKF